MKKQHIFLYEKKNILSCVGDIFFRHHPAPTKYAIQFPVGFRYNVVMWILFLLHLSQQNIKKFVKMLYRFRVYYFGFILIMLHTKIKGEWFWFLPPLYVWYTYNVLYANRVNIFFFHHTDPYNVIKKPCHNSLSFTFLHKARIIYDCHDREFFFIHFHSINYFQINSINCIYNDQWFMVPVSFSCSLSNPHSITIIQYEWHTLSYLQYND